MPCVVFLLVLGAALSVSTVSSSALVQLSRTRIAGPLDPRAAGPGPLGTDGAKMQGRASPVTMGNPDCSAVYGRDLDLASCRNALARIVPDAAPLNFGERETGMWDVVLPRRYLSDDGLCAFDIKVDPNGAQRDVTNYLEISVAAGALLHACVETQAPSTGGIVKQLGVNYRSLSVEMSRYVPLVGCHDDLESAPPSYYSCKHIIDTMQWSERLTRFGPPWQAGVEVRLPYFLVSGDGQCKMLLADRIQSRPVLETTTWASVWSGAVAINEMCVKNGKGGNASPASQFGNLKLFLFGRGRHPSLEILASLNMSASDLKMLSAFNSTLPDLDAPPPVANA